LIRFKVGNGVGSAPMYITILAFFLALELPLLVVHRLFPQARRFLPLGGDEFSQLAILLMTGVFVAQVAFLFQDTIR
jgi:hypothetical protein